MGLPSPVFPRERQKMALRLPRGEVPGSAEGHLVARLDVEVIKCQGWGMAWKSGVTLQPLLSSLGVLRAPAWEGLAKVRVVEWNRPTHPEAVLAD